MKILPLKIARANISPTLKVDSDFRSGVSKQALNGISRPKEGSKFRPGVIDALLAGTCKSHRFRDNRYAPRLHPFHGNDVNNARNV